MTTDAERRAATDAWTIDLREQQLRDLRAQLAAVTAERDAAVAALRMATGTEPGRGTGVWMTLAAYQDLLAQLAELGERVKAQMVQLAAVAAERDDYRSKFREMERDWQLEREQCVLMTAQRDALRVDAGALVRLRDDTDNVLWSLKPSDIPGAINWGDLGTRETQQVIDEQRRWYRVIIEEADPVNPALHAAVLDGLVALGWKADDIEIETDW